METGEKATNNIAQQDDIQDLSVVEEQAEQARGGRLSGGDLSDWRTNFGSGG